MPDALRSVKPSIEEMRNYRINSGRKDDHVVRWQARNERDTAL